jgi:hypothetical protein
MIDIDSFGCVISFSVPNMYCYIEPFFLLVPLFVLLNSSYSIAKFEQITFVPQYAI